MLVVLFFRTDCETGQVVGNMMLAESGFHVCAYTRPLVRLMGQTFSLWHETVILVSKGRACYFLFCVAGPWDEMQEMHDVS